MKGGIVIFAAGNEDDDYLAYPASYQKVLSVASIAPDYVKAWYSNYADWVDVTAPGGTQGLGYKYTDKCMVLSTLPNNGYGYMQGTSMACPHVSGIAALVVSKKGGPGFTPDALRKMLVEGVKDIDSYNPVYQGKMLSLIHISLFGYHIILWKAFKPFKGTICGPTVGVLSFK